MKPFTIKAATENNVLETSFEEKGREKKRKMVKPFVVDEEVEKEEKILGNTIIRPFNYVSDEAVEMANLLVPTENPLNRFVASAFQEYIQTEGKLPKLPQQVNEKARKNKGFNFEITLQKKIYHVWDTSQGEKKELFYGIKVSILKGNGVRQEYEADVSSEKIKECGWLTKATHSLADIPKGKDEKIKYERMIQKCIEEESVEEEIIYQRAGWRNVPQYGWKYVYHSGIIGGTCNVHTQGKSYKLLLQKEYIGTKEVFDMAMEMANICKNRRSSLSLLLFVHAGWMTTLFKEAGHRIDFSFMIAAPTNSRKTSLVTAVGKLFDREELKADAEFATATGCGIEKTLGLYQDGSVIIDDFKPGVNPAEQREIEKKLDLLLRYYGDGVQKKRMLEFSPNAEKIFFPIAGNCIITGEYPPNLVESSLTRLFLTEITVDDVDNEKLQIFQESRWILSTHAYDFLNWLTERFDVCVQEIQKKYTAFRDVHRCAVGRFAGMYATMRMVAEILCMYAEERGFWNVSEAAHFLCCVEESVLTELNIMGERLRKRDKATQVLLVLKTAIDNNKIAPVFLNAESCREKEEVYENEDFYFISTKYLRLIIEEEMKGFPDTPKIINSDEMIALLDRKGALDILEKDGHRIASRKLPIQRGNACRYLYIKKSVLENLDEN